MRGEGRRTGLPSVLLLLALVVLLTAAAAQTATPLRVAGAASSAGPAPVPPGAGATPSEAPLQPVAEDVVRRTLSYGPAGEEHTYDVYARAGGPPSARPTVLLVHGGSWEIGDKVEWVDEAVEIARRGWTAVSVNYRRTPTAPWPAPRDDLREALRHLQRHAPALGVDVQRTGALGDSVGGQLAGLLGRPAPGMVPVRSVVSWSGIFDLPGLLQQPSSGGCAGTAPCTLSGLAKRAVEQLMRCTPQECPQAWREASPAADLTTGAATFSVSAEGELIDPRQAWAMDGALARAGIASRVRVLPSGVHGRGNQEAVWEDSLRFLAATLLPETTPEFPRPDVRVTLSAPDRARVGQPVRLTGAVRPRALGSTVAVQLRGGDGLWRTVRGVPLRATPADTVYETSWTPSRPGRVAWRTVWRGGGGAGTSPVRVVEVAPR